MGLLKTLLVDGDRPGPRWLGFLVEAARHPMWLVRGVSIRRFAERSIIALVMQSRDNSLTVSLRRGPLGGTRLTTRQGHGEPNPAWIPAGHEAVRRLAERIDGVPGGTWGDLFDVPMTAHILGGCVVGASAEQGVVDPYHRVFGHPGLHVIDGSAVPANLGVNPSLTITAMAERATAFWPNRGDVDTRPAPGEPYRRLEPVAPRDPAVPAGAPAALRRPTA